ncbi:MAG: DUF6268 family outer membrane beta-barrel protein [Prevotellaceae bacterium]|nr:DUF6268 family outer membrane beta-barrel protein [Prevotellaceae bacterium]
MLKFIYSTFFLMLLFGFTESHAQGYLKVEHLTSSELKDELGNCYGSGDMQVISGGYTLPVSVKRFDNGQFRSLSAGISASFAKMKNEGKALEMNPDDLINANLSLSYLLPLSRKWSMMAVLGAGVYSSASEITSKSILANGGAVFIIKLNENVDLGFGAGVTNSYGTPIAMPMLYFSWHPKWKMKFQIDLTNSLKVGASTELGKLRLELVGIEMDGMSAVRNIDGRSKIYSMVMLKSCFRPSYRINSHFGIFLEAGGNWIRGISVTDRSLKAFFNTFTEENNDPYFKTSFRMSGGFEFKF